MFEFRKLKFRPISILCAASLLALGTASAQEEGKRVALIIGNNNYSISEYVFIQGTS